MSAGQKPRHKVIVAPDLVIKVEVAIRTRREICIASHRRETMRRSAHPRCLLMRHGSPRLRPSLEMDVPGIAFSSGAALGRSRRKKAQGMYVDYAWTAATTKCTQRNTQVLSPLPPTETRTLGVQLESGRSELKRLRSRVRTFYAPPPPRNNIFCYGEG